MFGTVTYQAISWNRAVHHGTSRYFWWSAIRLDTDPLNRHPKAQPAKRCANGEPDCVAWDPEYIWFHPGILPMTLVLSALPAFAVGSVIVRGLGRLGVSHVPAFMAVMPILIGVWYYSIGWVIDRWRFKRRERVPSAA